MSQTFSSSIFGAFNDFLKPVTHQIQPKVILSSQFQVISNSKLSILLLLTSQHLIIQTIDQEQKFSGQTDLCSDLFFEIILDFDNKISTIKFEKHNHSILLNPFNKNCLGQWQRYLKTKLSQRGFHNLYSPIRRLGKGSSAVVLEIMSKIDSTKKAVKCFSKRSFSSQNSSREGILNQINILRLISEKQNKHIQRIQEVYESQNSIYLAMDLYQGGNLSHYVSSVTEQQIKKIMKGLFKGLDCLHQMKIAHRDIKLQNLIYQKEEIIIIDFGLAVQIDSIPYLYSRCGTAGFVAPQIIFEPATNKISSACDIFSAGVVFYTLLTGLPLFQGRNQKEVYQNNIDLKYDLTVTIKNIPLSQSCIDLLNRMLQKDPGKRITAFEASRHSYFEDKNHEILLKSPLQTISIQYFEKLSDFSELKLDSYQKQKKQRKCSYQ